MDYSEITYSCSKGIATLTLNRPELLNPFSAAMAREVAVAIEEARADEGCCVLVITGAGRAFCAGGDVSAFKKGMNVIEGREYVIQVGRAVLAMHNFEKPIIAAVNGYAMGAGFNLALAADLIVAVKEAKFAQVFSQVGLAVDTGGSYFLPRVVGLARAKELVFTGRTIDAEEALKMGLINRVVEKENLEQEVASLATELAQGPSQALGLDKMLINSGLETDLETALTEEALAQSLCMQTEDHVEGVKAFYEKRKAKFKCK